MSRPLPSYLMLTEAQLAERAAQAVTQLTHCTLCPRRCGVDRTAGERGYCQAGRLARVASWHAHMWEEPPISGWDGSGTVFFSNCTARCLFCQNYPISQLHVGEDKTPAELARVMLRLQRQGCHNINLVTPTHYVPQIIEALCVARQQGLHIPLLYNTSGYDLPETLALLEGIVDIYLPDSKYADDAVAQRLSGYVDYVTNNRTALLEMARQVGATLACDEDGLAYRGMIVRHLVLPAGLAQTPEVLGWIKEHLGQRTPVSLMAQYFPAHRAVDDAQLGRRLSPAEYDEAVCAIEALGLDEGWRQELSADY
ncbi:MAG: radical SAM protein [Anaerolineales bacterium]